ncbi:hypothetical protein DFH06DRAFT_1291581 [Mycena polygramma]|nr:hypothetical protein DFH06DRAFT_1291581 [Mycena polygramma]
MTTNIDVSNPPPDYDWVTADDSAKEKDSTTSPTGPYVYYRMYTMDGAIPAKSAFDASNHFVGRIPARSVPPPLSVASVKRCVAHTEGLSDPEGLRTDLYQNMAAKSAMETTARLDIWEGSNNPGNSPGTAFVLLVIDDLTPEEAMAVDAKVDVGHSETHSDYLYYQLYTPVGEDSSKTCVDSDEPSIGRVERFKISPPMEPAAIKRCIARIEGKPIYRYATLYEDISAAEPWPGADSTFYGPLETGSAGSAKEHPMVLVQPERRQGLLNRQFKRIAKKIPMNIFCKAQSVRWVIPVGSL